MPSAPVPSLVVTGLPTGTVVFRDGPLVTSPQIGTDQAVSGTGTDSEATVRFEDAGEKRLLVAYAPLRKVG